MSHYIKIYLFSIPQCLMLVFNLNLFPPLKPSSISCCVSVPSAEMSTAPPNHRRGKPGGTAYLHFGLSLTTVQILDSQNLQGLSFSFLPPTISQPSSPGSTRPAWPDPPPRSLACPRAPRRTPPWRGSVGGGSGSLSLTRNMSSWPRVVAAEVKLPQSVSLC